MKKSTAISKFNEIFDATYDEALAFVAGKTGNILLANDILTDTYSALFAHLKKCNEFDLNTTHEFFLRYIKESTNAYILKDKDLKNTSNLAFQDEIADADKKIADLLNTEFEIHENQLQDTLILKKINRFILQKDDIRKKAFILHYYCNYSLEQVANLLDVSIQQTQSGIYQILCEIKKNFLGNYISK